jgi:hypothetical protein
MMAQNGSKATQIEQSVKIECPLDEIPSFVAEPRNG